LGPAFTVVVATFNRPDLLREALGSVAAQTVQDFECLVVDDGSHTAGPSMPDDDRFRLLDLDENAGLAHAWNTGVDAATGEAVAFLDDDDLWTPERLALAAPCLERADIAVCGARWLHEDAAAPYPELSGNVHDQILDRFTPNMGRTAIRRSVKLPFDERYAASQDVEWWLRQSKESTVASVPDIGLLSRAHDGPRTNNGLEARVASGERMLADHADYFATHPAAKAFRQYRIGVLQAQLGRRGEARRWLGASLRTHPSRRAAWALGQAFVPRSSPSA